MFKLSSGKVFLIIFIGLICLTTYFIGFNYYNAIEKAKTQNFERLAAIATTVELSIDGGEMETMMSRFTEKDDITSNSQNEFYSNTHYILQKCQESNGIISPIYTIHKNDYTGLFQLGFTSSEQPYFRHEYNDAPVELNRLYYEGGELGRYKTSSGEWLSVIHPIKNKAQLVVGALALDVPFNEFITEARVRLLINSLWSLALYLIVGLLMFQLVARAMLAEEQQKVLEEEKKIEKDSKQNELKSSISYARKIQQALWPKNEVIQKEFSEFFSINLPKDTVSGDFYWHHKIKGTDSFIVIHADCTGHGVPGAMMSVLGNTIFNEIVVNYGITEPDQILNLANKKLISLLQQKHEENLDDGMAVSIALVNKKAETLKYAGANQNSVIIRNGQLITLEGNKYPVGGAHYNPDRTYDARTVLLEEHDCLYLFSDGFRDQFGGPNNKKFLSSNFYKMLLENSRSSMVIQKQSIMDIFKNWIGDFEQVDDVSLVGIRF
ncbi:MAG: PP2C family protein-serine/threonine phosphatase [Flavobacteriales bacterium]